MAKVREITGVLRRRPAAPPEEMALALVALFSVAGMRFPDICAEALDDATAIASTASRQLVRAVGGKQATAVRFGAARVINTLCAACNACDRGRGESPDDPVMPPPR